MNPDFKAEQAACVRLKENGLATAEIAKATGLSSHQVKRRLAAARKRERLDPEIAQRLESQGIQDFAGLHSGWLIDKKGKSKGGVKGSSLYFFLGPDQEKIDFADAIRDVLCEIPVLPPVAKMQHHSEEGTDFANVVALADLHVGGHYGDPQLEQDFNWAVDDLVARMPPAEKAYVIELGDLLDANDHKGLTPHSGNPCDVVRDDFLVNVKTAIRLMRRMILRLAETHDSVEVHMVKGNHDITAYIAVLVALEAQFAGSENVDIVVTDDEYRVISWGLNAFFPHHGDTLKWTKLKDVFTDQFADSWAVAKAYRLIMTGHLHHEKAMDMGGCMARQFGTLHRPNNWAMSRGFFSYGGLTAIRVHKDYGYDGEVNANIKPMLKGKVQ